MQPAFDSALYTVVNAIGAVCESTERTCDKLGFMWPITSCDLILGSVCVSRYPDIQKKGEKRWEVIKIMTFVCAGQGRQGRFSK